MHVIAVCSLKGGTGKTMLAYNLAERGCAQGLRVMMVDFDPQEGSVGLADLRVEPGWPVKGSRIDIAGAEELGVMKRMGEYDLVVCDLPGMDSMALGTLLMEADVVLSPVGIGASDLMGAANFAWMARQFKLPVVFVGNNVPSIEARRETMLAELDNFGVEVCPVVVRRRVAHFDALRAGLGVCEAYPKSMAASEIDELWCWLMHRLDSKQQLGRGVQDG